MTDPSFEPAADADVMTPPPFPEDDPDVAAMCEEMAQQAALRSLVADMFFVLAKVEPESISKMRDAARHWRCAAELGAIETTPGMDVVAFHTERAAVLEWACTSAGMPHKSADVIPFPQTARS